MSPAKQNEIERTPGVGEGTGVDVGRYGVALGSDGVGEGVAFDVF